LKTAGHAGEWPAERAEVFRLQTRARTVGVVPLTPADIHNVEFPRAALGKRGYDEEQVDALLDEVSQEMINLLEANADLERRVGETAGPVADDRSALDALSAELDRALRALDQAERRAGDLRHELDRARSASAPALPSPSAESGDRVLAMARRTADQHLDDAERESRELIAEARQRSERLARETRDAVNSIEENTRRRQEEAETELQARHDAAVRDIAEMTRFVEDYHAALADQVVRQQRHLAGPDGPL
jgi:DivIVA domain-containing protein